MTTDGDQPQAKNGAEKSTKKHHCWQWACTFARRFNCWIWVSVRNPDNIPIYLTAIFTAFLATFAYYAWDEATRGTRALQGQLDEMKKSFSVDRAYVFGEFDEYGTLPIEPGITAKFWFKNYGRTPAILRTPPSAKCHYSADGFHPLEVTSSLGDFTDASGHVPEGVIIPTDKLIGPFLAKLDATKENIGKARVGIGQIYCQAIIGYADMRDNLRETGTWSPTRGKCSLFCAEPARGRSRRPGAVPRS